MKPYFESFRPEVLILGGQISKSFDLSIDAFRQAAVWQVEVVTVADTSDSAILGVASLLQAKERAAQ